MSGESEVSNVSRRQFLTVAGSAAVASSFAVGKNGSSAQTSPPPPPPVHYLVTIDVTSGSISYSAQNKATLANVPMHHKDLPVNPGDSVTWQAKTKPTATDPTPIHRVTILFLPNETPFGDGNGNPLYAFEGAQVDEASNGIGGTIGPNHSSSPVAYEYYVAVIDDAKGGLTYTDDPRIIVGNAIMVTTKGKLIIEAEGELKEAARLNFALREKIESVERKLNNLKESR